MASEPGPDCAGSTLALDKVGCQVGLEVVHGPGHQHSLASPNGDTQRTFDLWAMALISTDSASSLPVL